MHDVTPDGLATREGPAPVAVMEEPPAAEAGAGDPVLTQEMPDGAAPREDFAALGVAIGLPLVGAVLSMVVRSWLTVAIVALAPAIVVVYGLGLVVLVRVLRPGSALRRRLGAVPAAYRGYAWVWGLAFLVAAVTPGLGGFDLPWMLQAGLVGASAIVVGLLTGALWSRYLYETRRPA